MDVALDRAAMQTELPLSLDHWIEVRDGDDRVREIFNRHYSRRRSSRSKLFVGPGAKLVLITPTLDAIFVWRRFIDGAIPPQHGVNCAVFRNEGGCLSSDLIRSAEARAWSRWPGQRLYTYVNPCRVRRKRDPGRCFLRAGWRRCGETRGGLCILEQVSARAETV